MDKTARYFYNRAECSGHRREEEPVRHYRQGRRLPVDRPTSEEATQNDMQTIELDTRTDEHVSSNHETRK